MPKKGLMIDYEYCTGCHSCEVACKQEHDYPVGKGGIHLNEILTTMPDGRIRIDYLPFTTAYCDLCAKRIRGGETTTACEKHCQAQVITFGSIIDLAKTMNRKSHHVLYTPK